jgi:1-acyl-sn-glycerol-3-phosphate acyltransferase
LANADADALIRGHSAEAYREARERERDVILPDGTTHQGRTPEHWRRVALIVAKRTGRPVGLDTATRMLARRDKPNPTNREDSDPDEIKRLTGL